MLQVADPGDAAHEVSSLADESIFVDELTERFGSPSPQQRPAQNRIGARIDAELSRWEEDTIRLERSRNENVLDFGNGWRTAVSTKFCQT
jgi:hypothetical protein